MLVCSCLFEYPRFYKSVPIMQVGIWTILFCLFHNTRLQNISVLTIPAAPCLSYQTYIWTYTGNYKHLHIFYSTVDNPFRSVPIQDRRLQTILRPGLLFPPSSGILVASKFVAHMFVIFYFDQLFSPFCRLLNAVLDWFDSSFRKAVALRVVGTAWHMLDVKFGEFFCKIIPECWASVRYALIR